MKKKINYFKLTIMACTFGVLLYGVTYLTDGRNSGINYASDAMKYNMDTFIALDEEGNITAIPHTEIEMPHYETIETIDNEGADNGMEAMSISSEKSIVKNGVVVFKNTNPLVNTNYINARTKAAGYLNATYAPDAAYLGTVTENGVEKVLFKQSGVIGIINAEEVHIIDYDEFIKSGMITSYFEVKNGKLYHNITTNLKSVISTQMFGYKQDYMQEGKRYYSYDGHYFYDDYKKMTTDYCTGKYTGGAYQTGSYSNAINSTKPYYNYFLYLSQRSKTKLTGAQLDEYLKNHRAYQSTSKMTDMGKYFIENQDKYGVNALLMFASAINESAYGNSNIAQQKNNLFGHGASDAYPSYGAVGYGSPQLSIQDHAAVYISKGYTDPKDSRYFGPHLGNKESGANVCYASDSYWGEKAAAQCFYIVEYFNDSMKEMNAYNLGIANEKVDAYNAQDKALYNSIGGKGGVVREYPVILWGEVNGKYKIQSDAPLDSTGLQLRQLLPGGDTGIYDFTQDMVYVQKNVIHNLNTNTSVKPEEPEEPEYMLGDVSGDNKITSLDYVQIRNHIMGTKLISDDRFKAADVSKDGKITSLDYMMVRNHIMGVKPIS